MATSMVEIELAFEDETTKKINIGPFTPNNLLNLKANVKNFNEAGKTDWQMMIVNENGSQIKTGTDYPSTTPIKNVTIITSEETAVI